MGSDLQLKLTIKTRYFKGADLTLAQLLEMSNLRRSVMDMKIETDLAEDFANFCKFCQSCFMIAQFFDPNGKTVGISCYAAQHNTGVGGRRYLLIMPDYSFMLPEYRGHPAFVRAMLRMCLCVLPMWRGEQIWFGSIAYPTGMLLFEDVFACTYLSGESNLPAMAQITLNWLQQNVAGKRWDAQAGYVNMPTIPPVMSARWQANAETRLLYQRYIAKCPNWRRGYALAGVSPMNPFGMMWALLQKFLRRIVRDD